MTAPRAREQRRPPSPPDRRPPRRGGHFSPYAVTAAGRPASFARLAGARRALSCSARAVAVVACLCLAGAFALPAVQADTTDNGPHGSEHTHFYLWRTTLTVGESSGTLGYDKSDSLGSISTDADFGYPPWNPPHKHHVDRESYYTVEAIKSYEESGNITLGVDFSGGENIAEKLYSGPGSVTLWLNQTAYPFSSSSTVSADMRRLRSNKNKGLGVDQRDCPLKCSGKF